MGLVSTISLSETAEKGAGAGLAIVDSPDDLTNKHPHLWCRGYGPDNGLWQKAQTTHAEIWKRLSGTAHTGVWKGISRANGQELMRTAMAFVISKDPRFGKYCQSAVIALGDHDFTSATGGDRDGIGNMETFYGYCLAYDAIVDDPDTKWLTPEQKAAALKTMAAYVEQLNFAPGATWRVRPTHNFMVLRAGDHAAGLYNLRGEPDYEDLFRKSREFALMYHNERVNGLGDAPLISLRGAELRRVSGVACPDPSPHSGSERIPESAHDSRREQIRVFPELQSRMDGPRRAGRFAVG
jgi:hypothetical protein